MLIQCITFVKMHCITCIISSPEPKSTLSKMTISETSWLIIIKFHQEHHWGDGLAALDFGPDQIRTLVSMATDSSHMVIMEKTL